MTDSPFITRKETLKILKINSSTLFRWEKKGIVPFCKFGGCKRYRRNDIRRLASLPPKHDHEAIMAASQPYKRTTGIYFLINSKKARVVYVGQARDIPARLGAHFLSERILFDRYHFIEVDKEQLDIIERFYIRRLMPEYNISHKLAGTPREIKGGAEWKQTPVDHGQFRADLEAAIEKFRELNP